MKKIQSSARFSTPLSICLTIFYITLAITFAYLNLRILHASSSEPVDCIFYDRPPRTASSTIVKALKPCLEEKHYRLKQGYSTRQGLVTETLALSGSKKAILGKHVIMDESSLDAIRHVCNRVFFLTSTRPMKERLSSHAIGTMANGHGNSTLDRHTYEIAMEKAANGIMAGNVTKESVLESYPFYNRTFIPKRKLFIPDYVIRYHHLKEDLGALLDSFGCPAEGYISENVHHIRSRDTLDTLYDTWNLTCGDKTYKRLTKIANKRNNKGLRKARSF